MPAQASELSITGASKGRYLIAFGSLSGEQIQVMVRMSEELDQGLVEVEEEA